MNYKELKLIEIDIDYMESHIDEINAAINSMSKWALSGRVHTLLYNALQNQKTSLQNKIEALKNTEF